MGKNKLVFNKPVYLGMCILEISKTLMNDFHYNYIKSLVVRQNYYIPILIVYEIETEDVREWFDTSNYPNDHPSGIEVGVNKKVTGKFKDEAEGKQINEFVGLRSKLYSFLMDKDEEKKKCRGIKKPVVKKCISFSDYKKCS